MKKILPYLAYDFEFSMKYFHLVSSDGSQNKIGGDIYNDIPASVKGSLSTSLKNGNKAIHI